jgi:ABC-type nitrate/sulfonate/bicarbonate transport system permease component
VRRPGAIAARLWLVPAAVAGWELAARRANSFYFPPPSAILAGMHRIWFSGAPSHLWLNHDATANLLPSLSRLLGGWALASVIGIAVGVAVGRSSLVSECVEPMIHFGRAIPPPTLVPVFLVIFKIGTQMQLATIMFGVIWPVLLNSIDGARYVDRLHIDTARVFKFSRSQRLLRIILPAAAPKIFAGLRLSLSIALIVMVISEFVGSTNGLGRELLDAQTGFDIPAMWAVFVVLGILGMVLNTLFLIVERRVLAWHSGSRQAT